MEAIKIRQLSKKYGNAFAIRNVDITVNEGEIYGFIGPNGAGKSTTIKALLNFIHADSGTSEIYGLDSQKDAKAIRKITGYVSSDVRFYPGMTSKDMLHYTAEFHQLKAPKKAIDYLIELFQIDPKKKLAELSLGNKKKIALACGLLPNPKLLILDEPTNGLDPLMQNRLFEELELRNSHGMTIFLSSHDLTEIQRHAHRSAFIREGKIVTVQDIQKEHHLGKVVTIQGNVTIPPQPTITVLVKKAQFIRFLYQGELHQLAEMLKNPAIKDFTVEEPTLDDQFMSLYEGGTGK